MDRVYLSKDGYEKLVKEVEYLKHIKRKEIVTALSHARSLGDLKENAEYHAAKEALAVNEGRIRELEDKLSRAEIIEETAVSKDKIYIGGKVKLVDLDNDEELEYALVGEEEANPLSGLISVTSPVGKALLGHKQGDVVEINVPAGMLRYRVIEILR
ncbi:MAG: transcription elongation factor GreA [Candidatus Omnitrophica bacterium]|nr:transcription elongation factor GreA [Candidatus Omnitrophota bacterium]MBU0879066.1 transcription elongation factor GreA [Candidatus Omnitrophota bacterium]MBU0897360.1 transcription elongation factor GreA [Candidatus Omnitrophota bacterium]MBU1133882.1 transcription elongation factor GreA [Candidatus Omnitrophota bacterium]MBU1810665.1 transcription elongation factor GreA [Candidatus Omnitrophota bacterium]